jgi:type 1 glutamine amidotransferase
VRRSLTVIAWSICIVAGVGFAQQPSPGQGKLAVLIVTGQNGHNWRGTTPLLRKILEDTGRFEVRVTEEFRGAGPETLAPYDLVVLNYEDHHRPEQRWGEKTDAAFLDYVRAGKGVVVYHYATAAFDGWTDFEKLSAGNWRPNNGHHSAPHDFVVDIQDPEHPITKGLKLSFPQPNDELYGNLRWQPAGSFHVLATAMDDHALYQANRTDSKAPQPLVGESTDEPVLWTVNYGKGRVFVTTLGHDVEQIQTPAFTTTFARGAEWAATGKVTLPAPPTMAAAAASGGAKPGVTPVAPAVDPQFGTIRLFNGRNLDGLKVFLEDPSSDPARTFKVEDGILHVSGTPRGYVRTLVPYADYTLHVEWRFPSGKANSGVLLHMVNRDEIWQKGFEAQLQSGRAGDINVFWDARGREETVNPSSKGGSHPTGRVQRPAAQSAEKPLGEWNTFDIVAAGDTLTLTVNGVQVNRMSGVLPSAGTIGLQSEDGPVDFRNVTLTPLRPATALSSPISPK